MMYIAKPSSQFKRDLKREERRGRDMGLITDVIKRLVAGEYLLPKHKDHALVGNYVGYRECHITPDCLLMYRQSGGILYLARIGTHSDLF